MDKPEWEEDSILMHDGKLIRWEIFLPLVGRVYVEKHDKCGPKGTCPKGWRMSVSGQPGDVPLKAKTLEEAQSRALSRILKEMKKAYQEVESLT